MKKVEKILLFGILVLIFASCTSAPLTGRKQLKFISDEELARNSASQYRQIIDTAHSKGLLVNNTPEGRRLALVGSRISNAVETYMYDNNMGQKVKSLNWEFNLIKSNTANAFAMPGGKIAFYTGILPVLQSDAGIAFVMGHEIGHVIGGHHAEGYSQRMAAGGLAVITGIFAGNTAGSLVNDGLSLTLLKFSRDQEYEADKYGLIFMAMAGYNPEEGIKASERIGQMSGRGSGTDFLSTHPRSEKRLEELRKFLPEAMKYYRH